MKAIVIIPTYNERSNIEKLIKEIFAIIPGIQILVVDDNSPDGTGELVEHLSQVYKTLHIIHRSGKLGLASAYKEGFAWALGRNFDYIFQMDADLSHRPSDMVEMLEKAKSSADLVIGSRYKNELRVEGWSIFRIGLSYLANFYARAILGTKIYDMTSGFRCFRMETLRKIDFSKICSEGYAFQIEMAYLCWKKKYRIDECPIVFIERASGRSKLNMKIIFEAFLTVLRMRWQCKC
jgi:dolichol-phosphate mannosyltransferase